MALLPLNPDAVLCSLPDCVKPASGRRVRNPLCRMHEARMERHGDVNANFRRKASANYEVVPSGCWEWRGTIIGGYGSGYGIVKVQGRRRVAHRWIYEQERGPIPGGLHLDHLCRNTICVNPDHLEPVTCWVNVVARGVAPSAQNLRKTRCVNGHEFDIANTYVQLENGRPKRRCRACRAQWAREKAQASR